MITAKIHGRLIGVLLLAGWMLSTCLQPAVIDKEEGTFEQGTETVGNKDALDQEQIHVEERNEQDAFGAWEEKHNEESGVVERPMMEENRPREKEPWEACKPGYARCGKECVSLWTSNGHCGSCHQACPAGYTCEKGECRAICCPRDDEKDCVRWYILCEGKCVDMIDEVCGSCRKKCNINEKCTMDVSEQVLRYNCLCREGLIRCDGKCIDPKKEGEHCGGCSQKCTNGAMCRDGKCVSSCTELEGCNHSCRDLKTDPEHCGMCGKVCAFSYVCVEGKCVCPSNTTALCEGECVDTSSHDKHCGACGKSCPPKYFCKGSKCEPAGHFHGSCPDACGGSCTNIRDDSRNCGGCGNRCPKTMECVDAHCVCPAKTVDCNGACVDVQENPEHCGACGALCPKPKRCVESSCLEP